MKKRKREKKQRHKIKENRKEVIKEKENYYTMSETISYCLF